MGSGGYRVNVNLSDEDYHALQKLAEEQGKSLSDLLRDAISLEAWVSDNKKQGNRLLVETKGGQIREVVVR